MSRIRRCLTVFLLPWFCTGLQADDHGGDFANATVIDAENPQLRDFMGNLELPIDEDVFEFRISETTIAWIHTTGGVDTYLELYDAGGARIAYDSNSGAGYNAAILLDAGRRLTPGSYFVRVSAGGDSIPPQTGPYTLSLRTQRNAVEPPGADFPGSLTLPGQIDCFRINVRQETLAWLYTTGPTDTFLQLFDATGVRIGQSFDDGSAANGLIVRDSTQRLAPGVYYLAVSAELVGGEPDTGGYTLSIRTNDHAMPLNTPGLAGSLAAEGEVDYHRLDLPTGGRVMLFTTGDTDTRIDLYDDAGFPVGSDDFGGHPPNAFLEKALAAGTYWVAVSGGGNSGQPQSGPYTLGARTPAHAVPIFATGTRRLKFRTPGEVHYFTFATTGGSVDFRTTGTLDSQGWLYNQAGAEIARDDNGASDGEPANRNFRIQTRLPAGVYYLRVGGSSWAAVGSCDLVADFAPAPRTHVPRDSWLIGGLAHGFPLEVESNTRWKVSESSRWLAVDRTDGTGNGTLQVTVTPNRGGMRSAVMRIGGRRVRVTQYPATMAGAQDLDGDGLPDLIWQERDTGATSAWFMDRGRRKHSGFFGDPAMDPSWRVAGLGDFGDATATDIVLQQKSTGTIAIAFQLGTKRVSTGALKGQPAGAGWRVAALGDFDGDGRNDLVVQDRKSGAVRVWLLDRARRVTGVSAFSKDMRNPAWLLAGAGDADGDGHADLIWQNRTTGRVSIWFLNGLEVTGGGQTMVKPRSKTWRVGVVADFNRDGKADLVLQQGQTGKLMLWHLDGRKVTSGGNLTAALPSSAWRLSNAGGP